MGISIREILESKLFKNCKVLAGHGGLDNHVQGIAILDAPDGFNWTEGKELVISSGYVFKQNPGLFEKYIEMDKFKKISGMGIKVDRYLKDIPEHIIESFNKHNIPLIDIPLGPSWMDIMNQLNVIVMNKNIKRFRIGSINPKNFSDLSYKERKIKKILSQIEVQMKFPAMLYEISEKKAYYSSSQFGNLTKGLREEDFWNPSFEHTKEILCDNLKMIRYRFYDDRYTRPYSWITIPITVEDKISAYFVVVEATDLIDYFDQFSIRIGFLILQGLYEQMLLAQRIGDMGFSKLVLDIIRDRLTYDDEIANRVYDLGLDISAKYYMLLIKQMSHLTNITNNKEIFKNAIDYTSILNSRISFIEENSCIILLSIDDTIPEKQNLKLVKDFSDNLVKRLTRKIENIELVFGCSDISGSIYDIKRNYSRCQQAINIGKLIHPEKNYITYSELGAFAWLEIKEDELNIMLKDVNKLLKSEDFKEHVNTLRAYLENKMNFSLTAKQLYIHINTVRKRISELNDLLDFNLEDPVNRLKLELLLKLVK